MKRITRWILRGLLIALVLIVVAAGAAWIWQRGSLPTLEGELALQGLGQPVEVTFDADAIPTIHARTEADALFTLGFLHAQERLFQMDFPRRLGAGRERARHREGSRCCARRRSAARRGSRTGPR